MLLFVELMRMAATTTTSPDRVGVYICFGFETYWGAQVVCWGVVPIHFRATPWKCGYGCLVLMFHFYYGIRQTERVFFCVCGCWRLLLNVDLQLDRHHTWTAAYWRGAEMWGWDLHIKALVQIEKCTVFKRWNGLTCEDSIWAVDLEIWKSFRWEHQTILT